MARRGEGTDPLAADEARLLASQTGLNYAQIQRMAAESRQNDEKLRQNWQEIQDKLQLGREDIAGRQKVAETGVAGQKEVAGMEGASREKVAGMGVVSNEKIASVNALISLLGLKQKTDEVSERAKSDILTEIARRPDINPDILAGTMAASGRPEMQAALDASKSAAREKLIAANWEGIRNAKSDTERAQKFGTAMNAAYPGSYEEARSRIFPADQGGKSIGYTPKATTGATPAPTSGNAQVPAGMSTDDVVKAITGLGGGNAMAAPVTAARPESYADKLIRMGVVDPKSPRAAELVAAERAGILQAPNNVSYDANTRANIRADQFGIPRVIGQGDPSVGVFDRPGYSATPRVGGGFTVQSPDGGSFYATSRMIANHPNWAVDPNRPGLAVHPSGEVAPVTAALPTTFPTGNVDTLGFKQAVSPVVPVAPDQYQFASPAGPTMAEMGPTVNPNAYPGGAGPQMSEMAYTPGQGIAHRALAAVGRGLASLGEDPAVIAARQEAARRAAEEAARRRLAAAPVNQ